MKCLRCNADIGAKLGLCDACSAARVESQNATLAPQRGALANTFLWLQEQISDGIHHLRTEPQTSTNIAAAVFIICFIGFIFFGSGVSFSSPAQFKRPAGVLIPEPPQQTAAQIAPWNKDGWHFTALAKFSIRARVLVKAKFLYGPASEISPYDFTLGWGPMSDTAVLRRLEFLHGPRYVYWNSDDWPLSPDVLNRNASNLHAIPRSAEVTRELRRVSVDDIVQFEGYLVHAHSKGGEWSSSLTRDDTGNGACEVMWIDSVRIE